MAISTNSIIHYTKSLEVLKLILIEGFKIKYCLERLVTRGGDGVTSAAHPMVSFCDIPLSESHKHFDTYGYYGIGLTKEWASKSGLNPVLYIDKNSILGFSLKQQFENFNTNPDKFSQSQFDNLLWLKSHTKNYSGFLKRCNIEEPNYKFYDEREWRLVPEASSISNCPISIREQEYLAEKDKYNSKLEGFRCLIQFPYISYIIVKTEDEVSHIIDFLSREFYDKYTGKELNLLFSKVCSIEQIQNDY